MVRPIHFVLRYSDLLRGVDSYAAHREIVDQHGSVWWGKFGTMGASDRIVNQAQLQIKAEIPTFLFLVSKGTYRYRARVVELLGGSRPAYRPKNRDLVPAYYRNDPCRLWFRLTDLEPAVPEESSRIVLYAEITRQPPLQGCSRSLFYVALA